MMKRWLILLMLLVQTVFAVCADAAPAIPPKPAAGTGVYVQDYAGIIRDSDERLMQQLGQELDSKTSAQVAVLTIPSLEGESLEDYSLEVLRTWGIGQKGKDNGVLILIAAKDRKSRIEVGYGLEGVLPDGLTGRIQDRYMLPYFRKGDYSKGILQGYAATAGTIAKAEGVELTGVQTSKPQQQQSSGWNLLYLLGVVGFLIIDNVFLGGMFTSLLLMMFLRGGGGGRGGGGFGGGSGGGGGSSRSW